MVKGAGGEDSSWLGGCSLEGPDMLQQGVRYWGRGPMLREGGLCWRRGPCAKEGSREDRGVREEAGEEARRRPLERSTGAGRRRRLGGGPGHPAHAPTPCFPSEPPPGCLALGAEILARPCTLGRGAWIARQMGTRTGWKHSRESRGQSQGQETGFRLREAVLSFLQIPVPKRSGKLVWQLPKRR